MKISSKNAIKIVKNNNIIMTNKTKSNEYYKVKGKIWYDVIYNSKKDYYLCNCDNVRNTFCKHIKAVMLFKGYENDTITKKITFK